MTEAMRFFVRVVVRINRRIGRLVMHGIFMTLLKAISAFLKDILRPEGEDMGART